MKNFGMKCMAIFHDVKTIEIYNSFRMAKIKHNSSDF